MFEELRSHLAYECFDVARLPAPPPLTPAPLAQIVTPAAYPIGYPSYPAPRPAPTSAAAVAAALLTVTERSKRAPPSSTQISAVAQLLGEIEPQPASDAADDDWLYAHDKLFLPHPGDSPSVPHPLPMLPDMGSPILTSPIHNNKRTFFVEDAPESLPQQQQHRHRLPLATVNRAFVLAAEILRVRGERAAAAAVSPIPILSVGDVAMPLVEQLDELFLEWADPSDATVRAIRALVAENGFPSS
jgi:hypothetical protein